MKKTERLYKKEMVQKGENDMDQKMGQQSIQFERAPHIISAASVVGKKEGEGPLGKKFDLVCEDAMFGEDSWEKAESTLQKEALQTALGKAKLLPSEIRYLFGGDLLGQLIATSFGVMDTQTLWQQSLPATLPVRRSSFGSRWNMETSVPLPLPGRLREAEPLYLPQRGDTPESRGSRPEK